MKELAKLLLVISALIISLLGSLITMIYGWGVQPKSWLVILVVYPILFIVSQIFIEVSKKLED